MMYTHLIQPVEVSYFWCQIQNADCLNTFFFFWLITIFQESLRYSNSAVQ